MKAEGCKSLGLMNALRDALVFTFCSFFYFLSFYRLLFLHRISTQRNQAPLSIAT